jgi:hypothetical protein
VLIKPSNLEKKYPQKYSSQFFVFFRGEEHFLFSSSKYGSLSDEKNHTELNFFLEGGIPEPEYPPVFYIQ